jgi:hypothetical protein
LRRLFETERVADRSTHTEHIIGVEFGIVHDVVEVSFGTDEEMFPQAVTDVGANMKEKVIGVKVGGATYGEIATAGGTVKEDPLAANPGHEISVHSVAQVRREYRVYVIKDWAIFLKAVVGLLCVGGGEFRAVAVVVFENAVEAEAGIQPALLWRRQESLGSILVLGGQKNASANRNVNLLGTGKSSEEKKERTRGRDRHELSQIQPPFSVRSSFWDMAARLVVPLGTAADWSGRKERRSERLPRDLVATAREVKCLIVGRR